MMRAGQEHEVGQQRGEQRDAADEAEQPQARQVREHGDAEPEGQHQRGEDDGRADQHARAADGEVGARLQPLLAAAAG